ncbi:MAG: integral rane sensor signal transduction histidine kinase, partial [Solirubrobacterales bacterium]|nr:integral rane sensor signal transduction histidine kinase [Solirubrobacterales bacterium]
VASLSVALAVLAAAIGLYVAVRSDLRGEIDTQLRTRARLIAGPSGAAREFRFGNPPAAPGALFGDPSAQGRARLPGKVQPAPLGAASGYVQFIAADGHVFVPGGQGGSTRIAVTAADRRIASAGRGSRLSDRRLKGTELRVLTVATGGGSALMIARPLTEVEHELSHLLLILALIGGAGIVLAALLGTLVARTALAPIARFTSRTERLSGSLDLSSRLEVRGRDELGRLAESFNSTLDALERSVAAQRHLIADASHELRTPIASLRANIQVLGDADRLPPSEQQSLREDIIAELDDLTALVGDVVELARGAEPPPSLDDVRLDEVVEAAVAAGRRRGGVSFELDLQPTVVTGAADRIGRAVSNLIDNARKWSPPDGEVEVSLRDGVLSVRDHGPGFDEVDLPFVFDRFYRAESARRAPGSGLGLAIVRQAAESCGGFAEARNAPGGGALLRVGFGAPVASEVPSNV